MKLRWLLLGAVGVVLGGTLAKCRGHVNDVNLDDKALVNPARPTSPERGEPTRFAYIRKVRQIELSSLDERYDPMLLRTEEDITIEEIFARELRDSKYAPIFEQRIRDSYRRVIDSLGVAAKVRAIVVECKTLSCVTYVQVDKKDGVEMYNTIGRYLVGPVHSPDLKNDEDPTLSNITFHTLFEPTMREDRHFHAYVGPLIEFQLNAYRELDAQRAEPDASTHR